MSKQQDLLLSTPFQKKRDNFGGDLRKTRASRQYRPISTKNTMHLMLKSQNAKGSWSFLTPSNKRIVSHLIRKHADRNGVQIQSFANVGNHLHIMLKVRSVILYKRFVRALSGSIALKITGANKTRKLNGKFWTQTPFTRFVHGLRDFLGLKDYFEINKIEAAGFGRNAAEFFVDVIRSVRSEMRRKSLRLN